MSNHVIINPISYIRGSVYLPGSKSISNRAILLSAQAQQQTQLINCPKNDDIKVMLQALSCCKIKYKYHDKNQTCSIQGSNNALKSFSKTILLQNSGTAMRFLTAALSIRKNNVVLMGNNRMHQRPIGPLVDALRQGGAKIDYLYKKNFPPLK
uniref:Enolpyruvate transferase domain-containing protein n=1 Tax=Glossina pallidipes TaxID=7398 RepID=A0A1A9Z1K2_GLOPL